MSNRKKSRILSNKKGRLKKMRYSPNLGSGSFIDLNEIEEIADRSFFLEIGKSAAYNAVNENKALHIPVTFLLDSWIVRRMPNGDIQKIKEIKTGTQAFKNRKIAKGTILHVNRSAH